MTQTATPPKPAQDTRSATRDAPSTLGGLVRVMLTRSSPLILLTVTLAFGALRVSLGAWSWVDGAVLLAIAAWWPFKEWLIHTYLLHFKPRKLGRFTIDFAQARKHRRHHLAPWDFADVMIPLHTYAYAVPILCGIGYLSWGIPAVFTALTLYPAFGLHYEWCHFMAHSNYVPRSALYKTIWRNHRLHHFKNETQWMGVSTRLGDVVLGTCPDAKAVERSPTCRTLGIAPPA
ncbi:MAG: sterol desaturase family protein [Planctomycetes bacterium]|nr:sterol desaturase family protein [Planctomycetota bacterium]